MNNKKVLIQTPIILALSFLMSLITPLKVNGQSPAEIATRMVAGIPDPTYRRVRMGLPYQLATISEAEKAALLDWAKAITENLESRKQVLKNSKQKRQIANLSLELLQALREFQELYDDRGRFRTDLANSYGVRLRQFPIELLAQWGDKPGTNWFSWPRLMFHIIRLPGVFDGATFNETVHRQYVSRYQSFASPAGHYWSFAQGGGTGTPEGEPANMFEIAGEFNLLGVTELFPNDRFDKAKFIAAYPIALEVLAERRAKTGVTLIAAVGSSKAVTIEGATPRVVELRDGLTALWVKVAFGKSRTVDLADVSFTVSYRYSDKPLPLVGVDTSCAHSLTEPPSFQLVRAIDLNDGTTEGPKTVGTSNQEVELGFTPTTQLLTIKHAPTSVCFLFVTSGAVDFYTLTLSKRYEFLNTPQYITNHVVPFK